MEHELWHGADASNSCKIKRPRIAPKISLDVNACLKYQWLFTQRETHRRLDSPLESPCNILRCRLQLCSGPAGLSALWSC